MSLRPTIGFAAAATVMLALAATPGRAQDQEGHAAPATETQDHSTHERPPATDLPPGIPPLTDADREAAFPDVEMQHTVHDDAVHYFVLIDQLEWQIGSGGSGGNWDSTGWIGRDVDRFWFRTEGQGEEGGVGEAELGLLYGRAIARWWDVVLGVQQDIRPGPAQTWIAAGVQGLAPYWFEIEATAYVDFSARTRFRLEAEYELLFTNRLVLQPRIELNIFGEDDPERRVGAGLSTTEAGLRLRYEIRRELAPYVGVDWEQKYFGTADLARASGASSGSTRLVTGIRVWF